jgi:hypothetical protein
MFSSPPAFTTNLTVSGLSLYMDTRLRPYREFKRPETRFIDAQSFELAFCDIRPCLSFIVPLHYVEQVRIY